MLMLIIQYFSLFVSTAFDIYQQQHINISRIYSSLRLLLRQKIFMKYNSNIKEISNCKNEQHSDIEQQLAVLFPLTPYHTQLKIAHTLYTSLQQGNPKVVIVESPTGTGKTYALLIGTLAWLKSHPYQLQSNINKSQHNNKQSKQESSNSIPSWLVGKAEQNKSKRLRQLKQEKVMKLKNLKQAKQIKSKKSIYLKKEQNIDKNVKLQWQVQNMEDSPNQLQLKKRKVFENLRIVQQIFQSKQCLPKIIFLSRTHTQLSQVMKSIAELQLFSFRYVSMASKDYLCVHTQMEKTKVNEKCQYLLGHGGCPYYHQQLIDDFLGLTIQEARKLGEQNSLCSYFAIKNVLPICDVICLPYSSILSPQVRMSLGININNAIIIFDEAHNVIEQQLSMKSPEISYKELQQLCARIDEYKAKYGQKMKDDNLYLISHIQEICRSLMTVIKNQYDHKNNAKKSNVKDQYYYDQYEVELDESAVYQQQKSNQKYASQPSYVKMTKTQLFFKLKLPQIRVHRMKTYVSLSNFDQKLIYLSQDQYSSVMLNNFLDFITKLTSVEKNNHPTKQSGFKYQKNAESQIVIIKNLQPTDQELKMAKNNIKSMQSLSQVKIKILCMESTQFAQIAKSARMTVLAGGTMQPISSLTSIFKNYNLSYKFMKGEHIIKDEQCTVYCIGGIKHRKKDNLIQNIQKQKSQQICEKLFFTHNNMKQQGRNMMDSTQKIIKSIIAKTENNSGIVIFIQNYNMLQTLAQFLGKNLEAIPIFYDSNDKSINTFEKYRREVKQLKNSAVLVSVMGGRLSEGINFSDELARSIIVLGLPYPNIKAPQIIQKMKYLDQKFKSTLQKSETTVTFESAKKKCNQMLLKEEPNCQQTGQTFYENCCIRTINQTIGRGIRHINDYANIYLIDYRFAGITQKLSTWLQKRVKYIDYYQY